MISYKAYIEHMYVDPVYDIRRIIIVFELPSRGYRNAHLIMEQIAQIRKNEIK